MAEIDINDAYKEICQNIRESDQISFKLLSSVPLSSSLGAGVLTLIQGSTLAEDIPQAVMITAVIAISLIAATLVFGLLRWELRNIQKCDWLISKAAELEKRGEIIRQFDGWESQKNPWGKTESEKLIYSLAIVVWLVPIGMVLLGFTC